MVVALIGDLVGSRAHPDRTALQDDLESALATVNEAVPAEQPLTPTIGDEFQGVLVDVASALWASLLVRLALPAPADCRCGLGLGTLRVVGASPYGSTQDGPAWWAARDAVDTAARRARRIKGVRTWLLSSEETGDDPVDEAMLNAYLMTRDQVVTGFSDRQRRLALGLVLGRTQVDLAAAEGISQSAVSQALHASGAYAVLHGMELIGPIGPDRVGTAP